MIKEKCRNCGQWFDEDEMTDDLCVDCYDDEIDYYADEEDD